jgi:hypothetical protein
VLLLAGAACLDARRSGLPPVQQAQQALPRRNRDVDHRTHRVPGKSKHSQRDAAGAHLPALAIPNVRTRFAAISTRCGTRNIFEDIRLEVQDSPDRPTQKIVIFYVSSARSSAASNTGATNP